MKTEIVELRKQIALLEAEQKNLKPQRKTVHFTGERTVEPDEACYKVIVNRGDLRILYAAYGLMRGKKFSQIESAAKPLNRKEFYERTGCYLSKDLEGKHPLFRYLTYIDDVLRKYNYGIKTFDYNAEEEAIYLGE